MMFICKNGMYFVLVDYVEYCFILSLLVSLPGGWIVTTSGCRSDVCCSSLTGGTERSKLMFMWLVRMWTIWICPTSTPYKTWCIFVMCQFIAVTGSASASACAVVHYRLITYATYMCIQASPCTSRHRCCQSNSMQFPYKRQSFCHRSSLQTWEANSEHLIETTRSPR